ncbi:MAG: sigma factor, partial [Pseudomonadota bacterium]
MSTTTHNADTQRLFDEYLVLAVRSGDRAAGERLAARWRPRLLRTARRLVGDAAAAEDVVQDTWIG